MRRQVLGYLGICAAVATAARAAEPITTGMLIREMVDLRRLADYPDPAFKTVQFSSYDRRSSQPEGPGWFANADGFGGEPSPNFERVLKEPGEKEPGEYLVCDVKGPGAIVRTWTAAIAGKLRLYLDDADTPLYEGPAEDFLLNPYKTWAKAAGLDEAELEGRFTQRNAAYCPIPFARRCRIVWVGDSKDIHFYHVQVRLYEAGARVASFALDDLKTYLDDIRETSRVLSSPDANWPYAGTDEAVTIAATIPARQTQEVLALPGPKALERLTLRVRAVDLNQALRQTLLLVTCDGAAVPQVQAPIGDFFGAAPGINPYDSVPFTVAPDATMTCRYVMPCKESLKIVLDNRGPQAVTVVGSVLPLSYSWNDATSMHFRARWRVNHGLLASNRAIQDIPFLCAAGQGTYVGTAIMLLNPTSVPTPAGGWWGEGDEKIFVDDDVRPSTFGTGSEDYFNYAWSVPDIFVFPYCGQPRNDGPGNRGFVTNQRWHILDCLPFRQRLQFAMELCSHEPTPGFSYARIGYHYARPGTIDDHMAITDEDVRELTLPANWQPAPRGAVHGAVFYQAEELVEPGAPITFRADNLWAGGRLMVWQPAEVGDHLALKVPVLDDGKYVLHVALALVREGGLAAFELDDNPVRLDGGADAIDLGDPHRVLLRQFAGEPVALTKGEHVLTVKYRGPSPRSSGATIGIDYVGVQKRPADAQ